MIGTHIPATNDIKNGNGLGRVMLAKEDDLHAKVSSKKLDSKLKKQITSALDLGFEQYKKREWL